MRHREVDLPGADFFSPFLRPAGQRDPRLGPPADLDLAPGEENPGAERLADCLLRRKARGVVLGRVRPRVAVGLLFLREAAILEARVAGESSLDAADLDQ